MKLEIDIFKVKVNFAEFGNGTIEFSVRKYIKIKLNSNMFFPVQLDHKLLKADMSNWL